MKDIPHRVRYFNTWFPIVLHGGRLWNLCEVQPCWKKYITGYGL